MKIFYDSSICIDAARGNIPQDEWTRVSSVVSRHFRYFISPLTLDELLRGIHRGGPDEFFRSRQALALLYPAHKKTFLPYPGDFLLHHVFGKKALARPVRTELEMHTLVKEFLQCRSTNELFGKQLWRRRRATAVSELLRTEYWHADKQHNYATDYNSSRSSRGEPFDEDLWLKISLAHYEQPDTLENRERLRESLSANRLLAEFAWEARNDQHYNFFKHSSDLVDGQQLAYLADPDMRFVSNDRKMKSRIASSPQGASCELARYSKACLILRPRLGDRRDVPKF